jgi:hypothetical protein
VIATSQIPRTVERTLSNYEKLRQGTQLNELLEAADGATLHTSLITVLEAAATLRRNEQYRYSLQFIQAAFAELSTEAEAEYTAIAEVATRAARRAVAAAQRIDTVLEQSGLGDFLSKHGATLFWQIPYNPLWGPQIMRLLQALGIREQDIERVFPQYSSLEPADWDLLRLNGNDGTFTGLVRQLEGEVSRFAERAKSGIPPLEGREAVVVVIIVIGIIATIICAANHACGFEVGASTQ